MLGTMVLDLAPGQPEKMKEIVNVEDICFDVTKMQGSGMTSGNDSHEIAVSEGRVHGGCLMALLPVVLAVSQTAARDQFLHLNQGVLT